MSGLILSEVEESNNSDKSKRSKGPGFRLNSQQLFLTYSQFEKSPDEVFKYLNSKLDIQNYIIAQEKHKDGNKHIHAYLLLKKKINIRDSKFLDIEVNHPKIEGCRSWKNVVKYVTKDGNYITNYDQDIINKIIQDGMKVGELYENARKLAKENKLQEAFSMLEHRKTQRDLVIHGNAINRSLRDLVPKTLTVPFSLDKFNLNFEWDKSKTLVLWGETNTGKTSLAKALLPNALFVGHMDRLKEYNSGSYTGIIFDDMSFKHLFREAQIHLVDTYDNRDIHVRYGVAQLPAGTPRIITTNSMPAEIIMANDPAIARRIQCIHVEQGFNPNRSFDSAVNSAFDWVEERNRGATGSPAAHQ